MAERMRTSSVSHSLDGSTFVLVPARLAHALELPRRGASVVVTLTIGDQVRADAVADYAPYVEPRQFREVLGALRCLARTRWIDELVHRYVFERTVCERSASRAARFLEAELTKEVYFLGLEQIEHRTRTSVLYEGTSVAMRARAWLEQHLFEPFHGAALARSCGASESTVLRAFRKQLGISPFGYVRRRRLEEALRLLESGRYGVTEVATRVGYENPSAFAVAFRQQFVRAQEPGLFVIAEIFEQGSTQPFVPYLEAGFDSAFHFPLYAALRDAIGRSGSVDRVADAVADGIGRLGGDRALDLVLLVDNHDVARFANVPGFGVPEDEIRRRLLLALDLMFTLPGIPQLYCGDELGMYGGADPDNRRDFPAWATDAVLRAQPHPGVTVAGADRVHTRIQKLASLRRNVPAFADGAYRELWRQNNAANPNVLAFSRGTGAGMRLVVINNGAQRSGTMRIPVHGLTDGTMLVDELDDGAPAHVSITGGRLVVDLPPRSAAIYRLAI